MILFDKKLPVNHPSLKGFEKTVERYNTDSDHANISLRELDRAHKKLERVYEGSDVWGQQTSPEWQARYEAGRIEVVMEQIHQGTRSPLNRAVGEALGWVAFGLGLYPQGK